MLRGVPLDSDSFSSSADEVISRLEACPKARMLSMNTDPEESGFTDDPRR
jgi:hypothetical protein